MYCYVLIIQVIILNRKKIWKLIILGLAFIFLIVPISSQGNINEEFYIGEWIHYFRVTRSRPLENLSKRAMYDINYQPRFMLFFGAEFGSERR